MPKRMSKSMAAEIADRTLQVTNPQNRGIALGAALQRHGFVPQGLGAVAELAERQALIAWLLARYASEGGER